MKEFARTSILGLLQEILSRPGMTQDRIANESKIPSAARGRAIYQELKREHRIYVQLANWILQQTVFAGDPVQRAMTHLSDAGLSEGELHHLRGVINLLLSRKPVGTTLAVDKHTGIKAYDAPPISADGASEPEAPYARPIESQPRRVNRRDELPLYAIARKPGAGIVAIKKFEAVAAGFGEDLSPSPDLTYIRELPDWRDVHSIIVRGDSMEDTLRPDDLILVRAFHAGEGLTLDALSHGDPKTPVKQIEQFIPDDKLFIMSIGLEPPTVKRIRYDIHNPRDWHLLIVPDNPQYKTRVLARETEIRFWGQVVGIGEGKYVKR
jgi:hypothetical protein